MSDQQTKNNTSYQAPVKAIWVLAFIIPTLLIILLITVNLASGPSAKVDHPGAEQAIAYSLRPVATVAVENNTGPKILKTGEQVFATLCTSCHAAGVNGAPKVGDNAAWAPFIAKGYEDMLRVALNGSANGKMPARGGNPALDDVEVARALVYMANQSGAKFPEPAAPEVK